MKKALLVLSVLGVMFGYQNQIQAEETAVEKLDQVLRITAISLFRSEVQFEKPSGFKIEVGNKILANSYTDHKCLLVVTRVSGNKITTDASQCPGFGTLKKGDKAGLASQNEVNEEVRVYNPPAETSKNI